MTSQIDDFDDTANTNGDSDDADDSDDAATAAADDYNYDYGDVMWYATVAGLSVSEGIHRYTRSYGGDNGGLLADVVGT